MGSYMVFVQRRDWGPDIYDEIPSFLQFMPNYWVKDIADGIFRLATDSERCNRGW